MSFEKRLAERLADRKDRQLYRRRRVIESPQSARCIVDGKSVLSFCSNDYLGLANHPGLISAMQRAAEQYGVGSGASHLVSGHFSVHHQLEEALAEFTGRERALLFSSGYMANLGAINGLIGRGDAIFQDKLNHASLLDAGLLSGARFQRFLHNDIESLRSRLQRDDSEHRLVAVDGVFSMDGDIAPLDKLVQLSAEQNAWLMVDDAHGFGVLGETGAGTLEHFGLSQNDAPVLMATLGKAFGTSGAFVAGSEALIENLIQHARTYIYTTAIPPAVAAASLAALKLVQLDSSRRAYLHHLIARFRQGALQLGLNLAESCTAIQPLILGSAKSALAASEALLKKDILVAAIRPPTVPEGSARLRITLTAGHAEADIDVLLDALSGLTLDCDD